jgi:hypothetical protein
MRGCSSLGGAPHARRFIAFFLIESSMRAAVNDHGWDIFYRQYSHVAVQELIFISVKFYNVIKVLVRIDYCNISV